MIAGTTSKSKNASETEVEQCETTDYWIFSQGKDEQRHYSTATLEECGRIISFNSKNNELESFFFQEQSIDMLLIK